MLETPAAAERAYINELESYKHRCQELENTLKVIETNYKQQYQALEHKYLIVKEERDLLLYKRFARSAEQLPADTNQGLLFNNEAKDSTVIEEAEAEELVTITYQRKKGGRKPLDPAIPRKEKIIDIPESEKTCACGANLTRIGEETSEKLHIIPQQIYVEKTIRPKYACRHCEGTADETKGAVRIAPVEPVIIPKGIASPSLLSTVFTYKYERHLPFYRQEQMYKQIGADISRQIMAKWQQQVYDKLEPLFTLLKETVKSGPVLQMDETTVQVIREEERSPAQKSYIWLARGGRLEHKVVWYEYHPTRAGKHAKDFLQGYRGYLQTDGYAGYGFAVKDMPDIIHVSCLAHIRRYFFEALKANKNSKSAGEGINHIRKLYVLENELRDRWKKNTDTDKFLEDRKKGAVPILEKFKAWLEKRKDEVPPSMLLGKAIHYSLNQWDKMVRYLESPYLTPDTNAIENSARPAVLSRKNFLFCMSQGGAKSTCGMFTLIETAKQNGLVPYDYLKTLFEKAPYASTPEDWKKLLPWNIFTA